MTTPLASSQPSADSSPLRLMTRTTPTRFFNDSCATAELRYAVERGATGATSNPVICLGVLRSESDVWLPRAAAIARDNPHWSEQRVAWLLYQEIGQAGAQLLLPTFEANRRTWGRLSVQTDPRLYNDADAMLTQSVELASSGPNMQVKMPATSAGISMIEEATFRGVNVNVTVSFSVAQVLAIAEGIERGLERRDAEGLETATMAPVATIMIGRLDDWLKVVATRDEIAIDPTDLEWAGIACAKRAHDVFHERGFRTKLLAAAYRHLGHWTELVGGDMVLTIPWEWQVTANNSGHDPKSRIDVPVDASIIASLNTIADFRRAYEPDGMSVSEFDTFGPTVRTLRTFIAAWHDFVAVVRDVMLPDPDR